MTPGDLELQWGKIDKVRNQQPSRTSRVNEDGQHEHTDTVLRRLSLYEAGVDTRTCTQNSTDELGRLSVRETCTSYQVLVIQLDPHHGRMEPTSNGTLLRHSSPIQVSGARFQAYGCSHKCIRCRRVSSCNFPHVRPSPHRNTRPARPAAR